MTPIYIYTRCILLLLLFMGASAVTMADSLEAIADRDTISMNETLNFRLIYEGRQNSSDPDLSALQQQFEILSNQKSMQHSIINGAVTASTEWRLVLSPKSTGQLLIPPFTLDGQTSRPITVTVRAASKDPISGKEDVFLETFVDKSSAFVQEQFIVTYRLYYNRSVESLDAQQLSIDNARIEPLERVDYQKMLGHTQYGVAEYKYAVFADASGTIEIPAQTWTVRTTDQPSMSRFGFNGGRYKLHRVKTKPLSIEVKPKPAEYPNDAVWLPASNVTLSEAWSKPPESFKVGEPITRTITLRANGAAAEHLAPIFDGRSTADFKFYPDKPNQDKRLTSSGVVGTRTESVAIVPTRSGKLTLPAVNVTWWNTETGQTEIATLPERTVDVAGPAVSTPAPPDLSPALRDSPAAPATSSSTQSAPSTPWFWILVATLSVLTNAFLLILLLRRQRSAVSVPTKGVNSRETDTLELFKKVQQACDSQSPEALRRAILNWSKRRWGQQASSLVKVAELSRDSGLAVQLSALDAVLFAGATDRIDYGLLKTQLTALNNNRDSVEHERQLKPLYAGN